MVVVMLFALMAVIGILSWHAATATVQIVIAIVVGVLGLGALTAFMLSIKWLGHWALLDATQVYKLATKDSGEMPRAGPPVIDSGSAQLPPPSDDGESKQ